ncbi:hypothetical protein MNV49_006159 [Pseudohyphozyma bogoriensis]|nr:hypothetical protein MNV49_006159 [Pseudohyphozyma bogoriensis]
MPLRLPPKNKGKSKAPPIDYTSTQSAIASAANDADAWLEEGIKQEGQGERYLSGAKALRHYHNAIVAYAASAQLSSSPSFEATYNAARVRFHLATEHLPAPDCVTMLQEAIAGYRTAIEHAKGDGEGGENVIDASFNLAQALVELMEMVEEGAVGGAGGDEVAKAAAVEARAVFAEVERLQMVELPKSTFFAEAPPETAGDEEQVQEEDEQGDESMEVVESGAEAREMTIVLPSQVLDTVLASISLDLSLYESTSDPSLLTSIEASLTRCLSLRQLIPPSLADSELELTSLTCAAQLPLPASSPFYKTPAQIRETYESLLSATPSSASLQSSYADYLSSLPLDDPTSLPLLETALKLYTSTHSLLSSRLSPPKGIPAYLIPSMISANLASQAFLHLVSYHVTLASSPATATTALGEAHRLAIEAVNTVNVGLKISVRPTGELVATKSPTSEPPSWRDTKAFRDAYLLLVRIRLRTGTTGTSLALLGGDAEGVKQRYLEEIRGDEVWKIGGEGVEEELWKGVV